MKAASDTCHLQPCSIINLKRLDGSLIFDKSNKRLARQNSRKHNVASSLVLQVLNYARVRLCISNLQYLYRININTGYPAIQAGYNHRNRRGVTRTALTPPQKVSTEPSP